MHIDVSHTHPRHHLPNSLLSYDIAQMHCFYKWGFTLRSRVLRDLTINHEPTYQLARQRLCLATNGIVSYSWIRKKRFTLLALLSFDSSPLCIRVQCSATVRTSRSGYSGESYCLCTGSLPLPFCSSRSKPLRLSDRPTPGSTLR